ncbi:MAG: peptidoglycan editing factor PgeF [Desulfobulbaceae bacterium]|nr:peptidoglycan editing factor PgeF [Desulfobulbaceae bacterium]
MLKKTNYDDTSKADHAVFPELESTKSVHGIFSRHGGKSADLWRSLNVSYAVGDSQETVDENRQRIKSALGISRLVSAGQVHGDQVLAIEEKPAVDIEKEGYDALITNVSGIGLMVQQADCQAVLLFDESRSVAGVIHAGWRGSVANIIDKTIAEIDRRFDIRPKNLLAAVSPSLGPCCAEFINFRDELPTEFHAYQPQAAHFNFWEISRGQLTDAGVRDENITLSGVCTVCNHEYYSYRREGITGRFASVVGLL